MWCEGYYNYSLYKVSFGGDENNIVKLNYIRNLLWLYLF